MRPYTCLIAVLFITLLTQPSCKKYLDAKPDRSLQVPSSLKDLQAILDNVVFMNKTNPCWDEASADNYYISDEVYNSLPEQSRQAYIWDNKSYTYVSGSDWSNIYAVVYLANLVLESIEKIERTSANADSWDNIKGSALLYRSQTYLQGVFIYSQAYDEASGREEWGLVLRKSADFNEISVRSNLYDTYQSIIDGLHQATVLLKDHPQHPLRPSKAAAYGYLARTYLSMRKYDSAYLYANKCIALQNELLNFNNENIESMFPFPSFNKEVIFHKDITQYAYASVYPDYARTDPSLYDLYSEDDLRKKAYFMDMYGDGWFFKGTYNSDIWSLFTGIATDEMYITRAECAIRLDKVKEGLTDLNTLLENRWKAGTFVSYEGLNKQEALELVLNERRKELIFRGLRWMDIKRLNKDGANIVLTRQVEGNSYSLQPNDRRYALNLPDDILSEKVPQNP